MNIEELLNKYFEGETTCEEERELRRFFTRGIIPEHLQMYRPMFAFLHEENRQSKTAENFCPSAPPSTLHIQRNGCRNIAYIGYCRSQPTFQHLNR